MTVVEASAEPRSGSGGWRRRVPDWRVYGTVVVAVLLANGPYLIGLTRYEPLWTRSGLAAKIGLGFTAGQYSIDPNDGFTSQAFGIQSLHQLFDFHVPWWNPFEGLGAPLLGEMQGASTFPLLALLALPAGFLIFHLALDLIAGCTTAALARLLGLGPAASAAAGVLFGLSGSLVWLANAPSVPVPFLPMLLLGIERAFRGGAAARRRGVIVIAIATWFMLTAGFPEGVYLSAGLAVVYAIWRICSATGFRRQLTVRIAGGAVLGAAVAAPVIIGFLSYLRTNPYVGGHNGRFGNIGLTHEGLGFTFTPYAFGPLSANSGYETGGTRLALLWGNVGGYTTAAVLMLGLIGVTGRHLRPLRVICAAWVLLALAKTFAMPGLTPALNHLPGMSSIAFYRYAYPTWTLCLILLAALGVNDLARGRTRLWRPVAAFVVALGVLAVAAKVSHPLVDNVALKAPHIRRAFDASYIYAGLSIGILLIGAVLVRWRRRVGIALICALVGAEAVVMFAIPSLAAPRSWHPDTQLVAFLHRVGDAQPGDPDFGRVYSLNGALNANYGSYYDVGQVNVNDNPEPALWSQYVQQRLDPTVTGGRLNLTITPALLSIQAHLAGYQAAGIKWVFLPRATKLPPGLTGILTRYEDTATTRIYELAGTAAYFATPSATCTVTPQTRTSVQLNCPTATTLVRRELTFPGWRATVDGRSVTVTSYDTYFQSITVPAGRSTVRFSYVPSGGNASVGVAVAGVVVLVLVWTWGVWVGVVRQRWPRRSVRPRHAPVDA